MNVRQRSCPQRSVTYTSFSSQLSGNIMSDAFGVSGVGASTACYGLIGVQLGRQFLVEWPFVTDEAEKVRISQHYAQNCGMLVMWEIMNWSTIDHFGHGGGLISGRSRSCVFCFWRNFE